MKFTVPSLPGGRKRWRATMLFGVALACVPLLSGCQSSFKKSHQLIPGPSGAVGGTMLAHDEMAVLAGGPTTRAVFVIDLDHGDIIKSFGVTREATGIAAVTPEGPLLVSVGGESPQHRQFGAVERWSLAGYKTRVVPMPLPALGITRAEQGTAYVLLGNRNARAALPLTTPGLKVGKPIPLDANARTLQQCVIGAAPYLVYAGGKTNTVVIREIDSGTVLRSSVVADSPICIENHPQIFAISHGFAAASVVKMSVPSLLQQALIPASNDALALYETDDHRLAVLNATPRVSDVEIFPDDVTATKAQS
jgi:hypothetical protein